ncbi:MAG: hypothetical protein ABFE01_11875, partial [Phycisphaerales bacterium]
TKTEKLHKALRTVSDGWHRYVPLPLPEDIRAAVLDEAKHLISGIGPEGALRSGSFDCGVFEAVVKVCDRPYIVRYQYDEKCGCNLEQVWSACEVR